MVFCGGAHDKEAQSAAMRFGGLEQMPSRLGFGESRAAVAHREFDAAFADLQIHTDLAGIFRAGFGKRLDGVPEKIVQRVAWCSHQQIRATTRQRQGM